MLEMLVLIEGIVPINKGYASLFNMIAQKSIILSCTKVLVWDSQCVSAQEGSAQ